jgi:hypothetical protein
MARIGDDRVRSTGVVVDGSSGLVLVSARAIWGARSIKVGTGMATVFGRIVARNPCDDYAVLRLEPWLPGLQSLPVSPRAPRPRQAVSLLSRPWSPTGARERVSRHGGRVAVAPGGGLQLEADLPPSTLGAPVVDGRGGWVGVRGAERVPGAAPALIPATAIRAQLGRLRPGKGTVYVGWRDRYGCVGRLGRLTRSSHSGYDPADADLTRPIRPTRLRGTNVY